MSVKQHYDNHLGNFYSWMIGDFDLKQREQQCFLEKNAIIPITNKIAIDLGAGNGLQSVSLANLGFKVTAIDFNRQLLNELINHTQKLPVEVFDDDIINVKRFATISPELIICAGDTLTHLESKQHIHNLLNDCCEILQDGGKFILSFRDYSKPLEGIQRFIPVKSETV